jgi:hypothetical protein
VTPDQIAAAMPQIEAHVAMGLLAFPAKQVADTKVPAYAGWQSKRWDLGILVAELDRVPYYGLTLPKGDDRRLVVIDLDDGRGGLQPGQERWQERWKRLAGIPKTKVTSTPSGGAHAWFLWPDEAPMPGATWHGFTVRRLHGAKNWVAGPGSIRPDGRPYQDVNPGQPIATMPVELARSGQSTKLHNGHADGTPERLTTRDEILSFAGRLRFAGGTVADIEAALVARLADGRIYASDPARPWTRNQLVDIAADIGGKPPGTWWTAPIVIPGPAEAEHAGDSAPRFARVDLATVAPSTPELVLGIAYRGFQAVIVGPTGSAKTMLCQGLLLEAVRGGIPVGHWDHEMGADPIAFRYRAMGATDDDLGRIAYYPWPEPRLADSDAFVAQIVEDGSEIVLLDPTADFLGAAGLDENDNAEVTRWAAAFPQRLTQADITTITVDGMPHDGTRQRGASQKGYKAALVWTVEVLDEPSKDHVGSVALTCTKDRFGDVGKGAQLVYAIGGDGAGAIVVAREEARARPSAIAQHDADRSQWIGAVTHVLQTWAPSEGRAITQNQLLGLLPAGKGKTFRREACQAAASQPMGAVRAKPGPNRSLVYWYQDSGGTGWDGVGQTHSDPLTHLDPSSGGSGGSTSKGTHLLDPLVDPPATEVRHGMTHFGPEPVA